MILWLSLCIVEGRVTFLQISVHDIHAYFLRICREYCVPVRNMNILLLFWASEILCMYTYFIDLLLMYTAYWPTGYQYSILTIPQTHPFQNCYKEYYSTKLVLLQKLMLI